MPVTSRNPLSMIPATIVAFYLCGTHFPPSVRADRLNVSSHECSAGGECTADSDELRPMRFEDDVFMAYVTPEISTFYREAPGSRRAVSPEFTGIAGKFINMSPESLELYWQRDDGTVFLSANPQPFEAVGTATFPTHKFFFAKKGDPGSVLIRFEVERGRSLYAFDPFSDDDQLRGVLTEPRSLDELSPSQWQMYDLQKRNLAFAEKYREFTRREWLSLYPKKKKPMHMMWRADYFGQQHWVETRETHFASLPPEENLGRIEWIGSARRLKDDEPRLLQEYRSDEPSLNLTLTVISCAPRAFEIRGFLSDAEADHVLDLATSRTLRRSVTSSGVGGGVGADKTRTRTSENTWVDRERTAVVDAIYRRAADLLRIDEALLRARSEDEWPDVASRRSIAEALQLVHYAVGQEYRPHHDFMYPRALNENQSSRFATLLLYLNEGVEGGETSFPRWVNSETGKALKVAPEKGKAILFYSHLPDGNMDDLSQHASLPVIKGEKWLSNLWLHDPFKN